MNTRNIKRKQRQTFPPEEKRNYRTCQTNPYPLGKDNEHQGQKRIVRLLISDITVTKDRQTKLLFLNVRWQAGPFSRSGHPSSECRRQSQVSAAMVEKVRALTMQYADDKKTIALLNEQGLLGAKGRPFTLHMIKSIRYKYQIIRPLLKSENEYTVNQVQKMFNISSIWSITG